MVHPPVGVRDRSPRLAAGDRPALRVANRSADARQPRGRQSKRHVRDIANTDTDWLRLLGAERARIIRRRVSMAVAAHLRPWRDVTHNPSSFRRSSGFALNTYVPGIRPDTRNSPRSFVTMLNIPPHRQEPSCRSPPGR